MIGPNHIRKGLPCGSPFYHHRDEDYEIIRIAPLVSMLAMSMELMSKLGFI